MPSVLVLVLTNVHSTRSFENQLLSTKTDFPKEANTREPGAESHFRNKV